MRCPDENELVDLAVGRCDAARRLELDDHLDGCVECADELALLLSPTIRPPTWGVGDRLGRYLITSRVGRGGMGVVFAAQDELLGRTVAVKVLRTELRDTERLALINEAQALAKMVHPNIVRVFDVGVAGDDVFFAMAMVEGITLRAWLRGLRDWRDALEPLCTAGDALAAAHREDVTHGDFKPDNVLVTPDGSVMLVDFGLATLRGFGSPLRDHVEAARRDSVIGTPSYLAPELHAGVQADSRSDQYAFAVTAFEAVFGHPPFGGHTIDELARAKAVAPQIPNEPRVPARLRRALVRALSPSPPARWPDLEALVGELRRVRSRRPPPLLLGVGAVTALGLSAIGLHAAGPRCDPEGALVGIERRWAEVVGTLAPQAAVRGRTALDAATSAWRAELTRVCTAAQTDSLTCLERRKAEIASWLDVLATQAVRRPLEVLQVIDALGDEVGCDRPMSLREAVVHERLALAKALRIAGDHDAALDAIDQIEPEVIALAMPGPATVLARERAMNFAEIGDPQEPEAVEAWLGAAEISDNPEEAARAAARLATIAAESSGGADRAEMWLARADSWIVRTTEDQRPLRIVWLIADAAIAWRRRDIERATDDCRAALALAEELGDAELRETSMSHLGTTLARQGRVEESIPLFERQLDAALARVGPEHPRLVRVVLNLGASYSAVGRHAEALRAYERARSLLDKSGAGPNAPERARIEHNLSALYTFTADYPRAEHHARQALATAVHATESATFRLDMLYNLGAALDAMGRSSEQEAVAWRGAAEVQAKYGDEHPLLAGFLDLAGDARAARGEPDAALALHRRALAIAELDDHPDPVRVAEIRLGIADDLVRRGGDDVPSDAELGDLVEAAADLNARLGEAGAGKLAEALVAIGKPCSAIPLLDRVDPGESQPRALFARAKARRACDVQDNLAIALARAALAKIADSDADAAELRAEITAWLGANRGGAVAGDP